MQSNPRFIGRTLAAITLLCATLQSASAAPMIFTNAAAEGAVGPNQASVNAAYRGTSLDGLVTVAGLGIQQWTVQTSGLYNITAAGAAGGSTTRANGGRGASITVQDYLTAGDVVQVLIGQMGGLATFGGHYGGGQTGGGGGGTFIVDSANNPLLVAGGGGGAAEGGPGNRFDYVAHGLDAAPHNQTAGQNGTSTAGSWSRAGIGGTNGGGGLKPARGGAGGGGFSGDGQGGGTYYAGHGGQSFLNGGRGGDHRMFYGTLLTNIAGGFGGGAGAGTHQSYESNAGGGGGYSGGGGGNTRVGAGGGGGNFYVGDFISASFNTGHGFAVFDLVSPAALRTASVSAPGALLLMIIGLIGLTATRRLQRAV